MADKEEHKKILETMRKRFKIMLEADQDNRRDGLELMKFINVPGEQWDENMKEERGNRPCWEFNKLRVTCKRIINDMRSNRPSGKVRGVEGGDPEVADIYSGLIRNIWNISDGDTVTDYASEYQVSGGMGAWRIVTEYVTDDVFDQDIKLEAIPNPFCLFCDPSDKTLLKKNARDWILTEKIPKETYEKEYPGKEVIEFESHEFDDDEEWASDEEVRIAEYWYKEPVTKEIWQLTDGKIIEADTDEAQAMPVENIKNKRTIKTDKIMMVIASGDCILEGPTEWAGSMFPFVMLFGEYFVIDGKVIWHGAGRFGMDAQRSYNVARTAIGETIAQAPQSKYWATAKQAEGNTEIWAEAHKKNFPWMPYNPDPNAPGPPTRMGAADVPIALMQESQLASEEINMVTGIYAHDIGAPNAAKSGRQELARQQQGAIATFNFQDNLAKAHKYTWELLIDLIPQVYDTERELRILGKDDAEDYVKINTFVAGENGEPIKINDLSVGRYDVTITTGPSFVTKRQEAAEMYHPIIQSNPELMPMIGDLVFKSMDLPYAEEIAERLLLMAPPQVQQMMNGDKEIPPEVMIMMEQAKQAMAMVEQQMQEVQAAANDAEISKSEVEKLLAQLDKQKAQFDAHIAQQIAKLAEKDAKLTIEKVNKDSELVFEAAKQVGAEDAQMFSQAAAGQLGEAMQGISRLVEEFSQHAIQTIADLQEEKDKKPKLKEVKLVRENGEVKAVPEYEQSLLE